METIARNRGISVAAAAGFSRVKSLRPPGYPTSETIPAIAPGAVENSQLLVIASTPSTRASEHPEIPGRFTLSAAADQG